MNGTFVERYAYDPYGQTQVLNAQGGANINRPIQPGSGYYYHDADFDGDLDEDDLDHFTACYERATPECVFHHDRDGDAVVSYTDLLFLLSACAGDGELPHPGHERPTPRGLDAETDGPVERFDPAGLQAYAGGDALRELPYAAAAGAAVDGVDEGSPTTAFQPPYSGPPSNPACCGLIASRYGNPFMWTGQRYDAATGLYHFTFRTYDPTTAHWHQRDMLGALSTFDLFHGIAGQSPVVSAPAVAALGEY